MSTATAAPSVRTARRNLRMGSGKFILVKNLRCRDEAFVPGLQGIGDWTLDDAIVVAMEHPDTLPLEVVSAVVETTRSPGTGGRMHVVEVRARDRLRGIGRITLHAARHHTAHPAAAP